MLTTHAQHFIFCLSISLVNSSLILARTSLQVGESVPNITFTDIDGNQANLEQYFDRIIILSVAGRTSSTRLQKWMDPANLNLFKVQPDLRIAYVSIADVSGVPNLFRGVVSRMIKSISQSAHKKLAQTYQNHNITVSQGQRILHLIPDWRGDYLSRFGLSDGDKYAFWIIHKGVVVAAFTEGAPDLKTRYVNVIKRLVTL